MKRQHLPLAALQAWSKLNNIEFHGVDVQHIGGHPVDKGAAVIASRDVRSGEGGSPGMTLMRVPQELVLSAEKVAEWAKVDGCLREVLEAVGDFGKTDRGAVLIFLVMQLTISSLAGSERLGVTGPWTEYVRFLPVGALPTCWTEEERDLLAGTSLQVTSTFFSAA
ncbi:hypothetical protein GP486_001589 [Trichoglossum hirsutum]|uniref:Uncharacterized protein n=1 Tax=Trichoglossum hirsutum TaxID=265104 RepID=A0A9P8LGK3_9PEZI|nr:hypothetical protein GP486_001589 [Trichoglossum hirsutum]